MNISYKNNKIKKVCTVAIEAEKKYGQEMAIKIHQRIDVISAADSVEMLVRFRIGRCRPLKGNRKGEYGMEKFKSLKLWK